MAVAFSWSGHRRDIEPRGLLAADMSGRPSRIAIDARYPPRVNKIGKKGALIGTRLDSIHGTMRRTPLPETA